MAGKIVQVARFTADGAQVTREFDKMGDAGVKMGERVRQGAQSISPALRAVDASAGVARDKIEGLAGSAGSLGTVLRSMGPAGLVAAAGVGAASLAITAMAAASREAVRDLGNIATAADRVGVSTDALQELRFAVVGFGGEISQADAAFTQFAEKLGEATLTQSGGGFNILTRLGFTPDEIANMRSIEEALPRIADRIAELGTATEQMRAAKELGLEPLLPLLQQGAGAFDRAAESARNMGYVLDRDVLTRARELNGEWAQASQVIDLQLKQALIDLAPTFIEIAGAIATATRGLVDFLDRMDEVDSRSTRTLEAQAQARYRELTAYRRQYNLESDASGRLDTSALTPTQRRSIDRAQDAYFDISNELAARAAETARRSQSSGGLPRTTSPTVSPAAVDTALQQHQQFIDQLRAEADARDQLRLTMDEFPKATREEVEARIALSEQLERINSARAAGVEISDGELARLQKLAQAHYEEAAAARANADQQRALDEARSLRQSYQGQFETPQERIAREIRDAQYASMQGVLKPDEAARVIRRLRDEYRELAAAQHEASLQGQVLAGVMQGQIRDLGDVGRLLASIAADALTQELLAGGVMGEGGVAGYLSRVGDRIANSVTGGDDGMSAITDRLGALFDPLEEATTKVAASLRSEFASSLSDSTSKIVLGTAASLRETTAKGASSVSLNVMTKSANAAAAALSKIGAEEGGKGLAGIAKSLISAGVKGGGRAGGGPTLLGATHGIAEHGPEISIVGGWGQVVPNQALDGLALIARIAQRAAAAPAPSNGAMKINLINQVSGDLEAEAVTRMGPDGEAALDIVLRRKTAQNVVNGGLDDALAARFGAQRTRLRR